MIQIILAILAIILVIYGIFYAIGAILTTLAWISSNVLLFLEKCFFISNAIPPWVSWGIFGLIIGLVVTAYKEAPRYGKAHLRPLLVVFQIGLIGGLCLYNMNRLEGVHEATSEIQSYQTKTSTREQSTSNQKESNSCIATVAPDRWKGEYFNNENLQGSPSLVRDDGSGFIDFHWGNKGPCDSCGIGKDNFSVRWTRTVSFDSDTYRFIVTCDKDCRLRFYVDNELKYSRGSSQSSSLYTQDVPLASGKHTIKLEYYKYIGDSSVKLSWQKISTPEQPKTQSPVTYNLNGEWDGKVDNKPVKLSIAQDGNSLSGNIVYDTEFSKTNVKEHLSGEINNDKIVLKGTGYTAKGVTSFSLDTFSGTISSQDGDFIRGNYTDEAGNEGSWSVKRVLVASYPDINNANTDVRTQSKIGEENTGRELSNNNRRDGTNRISSFFSTLQDSNRNHSTKRDSSVKVERYTTTRRYQLFDKEKKVSKPRTETRVRKQTEKKPKKSKKSKKKSK